MRFQVVVFLKYGNHHLVANHFEMRILLVNFNPAKFIYVLKPSCFPLKLDVRSV